MLPQPREPIAQIEPSAARDLEIDAALRRAILVRTLRHAAALALQAVILAGLVLLFFLRVPGVDGHSMAPQIDAGDHVVITTLSYFLRLEGTSADRPLIDIRLHPVARGDVIAFEHGGGDDRRVFVKRVIGLPGDIVAIQHGIVSVNGRALDEQYAPIRDATDLDLVTVPVGALFVLGDNRGDSSDSRSFGPVPEAEVVGRAALVVWPPDRVRAIR